MIARRVGLLAVFLWAGCGDSGRAGSGEAAEAGAEASRKEAEAAFQAKLAEDRLVTGLCDHALGHARAAFDGFDPRSVPKGRPAVPEQIVADLKDPKAKDSPDKRVRDAAAKFPGYKYVITFEDNDLAVPGSSVVVDIEIFAPSGLKDEASSHKWFLSRGDAERFPSPSIPDATEGSPAKPPPSVLPRPRSASGN